MPPTPVPARAAFAAAACLLAGLSTAACHDAAGDPVAVLLTEETRATLGVGVETTSFADLVARAEVDAELAEAAGAWAASWDASGEEARALREQAYAGSAGRLVELLGEEPVRGAHGTLGAALQAARALPPARLTTEMGRRIADGERLHREAEALLAAGRADEALVAILRASDGLRQVGPEGVARLLAARAQRALDEHPDARPRDLASERAARLLRGTHVALDQGDWSRAIRRAYYACQLLGVSPR